MPMLRYQFFASSSSKQHQNKINKMMKIFVIISTLVAIAAAKPDVLAAPVVAAPAPLVAAPVVTASSSQYYHRINNGLAAYVAAPAAYLTSAPYVAASAPYVAAPYPYSAPIVAV
ncbi:uncharacterized protein LOC125232203 [Leguminivora glycinivorella]|uniref:uncharacterized protein LOC125232203 n=1 Tax=Leguminivora glycinivorella TaxID=1035111 RepID=UPI00200FCE74|nr:uncharacterized protein LOC125232203 [Leguminivora glycinivorella]